MNLVQTLVDINDLCAEDTLIMLVVSIVKAVFTIIQFGVPAVLIILCAIDMFKAMTNGDEKEVSKAKKNSIRRLIYALIIFLIVPLLKIIMNTVNSIVKIDEGTTAFTAFFACWDKSGNTSGSLIDGVNNSSVKGKCWDANGNEVNLTKSECEKYADYFWDTGE